MAFIGHQKAVIPDLDKRYDISIEVNWTEKAADKVRITIDGKQAVIRMKDLVGFVLLAADPQQQDAMMPVRKTELTTFVRQFRVKATKPIKPGEYLVFNANINVPTTVVEGLSGVVENAKINVGVQKSSSGIITT